MNKSKKLTAAVAASAVASALVAPAAFAATDLTDIDGSFAKDAIKELVDKGIINGKGDGKFDPTGQIERQDFAIILAKALNLDVAAAPATATFTDVPTTDYSFKYVEAAVKAGLIKGEGNGKFGAGANLSRQDMAVLFVRALGNDVTGKGKDLKFSDAGEIADYAKDAVAAAVELGLIAGNGDGSFNPYGNAERQAVALVASKFLKVAAEQANAKLTGATAVDTNTVTLTFSKEVEKLESADVAVKAKATGAAVNVSTVTLAADKKSATVKTASALASGTTYTVAVGNATVEFTTAAKPEVSAVTALNLKQVKVEFTGEVSATEAKNVANYTITGTPAVVVEKAEVQADGKTVILTTTDAAPLKNQESYKLDVKSQRAKDGSAIANATKDFTAFDNTVPTAKEVTVVGPNAVKVTFSAPIKTNGTYILDGGSISVTAGNPAASNTEYSVTLNVGADLAEGTHSLTVAGSVGFNDLKVADQTLAFTFAKDTVAPTIASVTAGLSTTDSSTAEIKFSEPVAVDSDNSKIYAIYNGLPKYLGVSAPKAGTAFTQNGVEYSDTYVVTFNGVVLPTGNITFYVNNVDDNNKISDTWGNEFVNATASATVTVDNVKPTVAVVKAVSQSKVTVEFSESVDAVTAQDLVNYSFLKEDGTVLAGKGTDGAGHPSGTLKLEDDKKTVTISGLNLAGGTFKLKVAGVTDVAVPAPNEIAESTTTFAVVDTSAPEVSSALYTSNYKTLFVNFSKPMEAASITDLNNYEVDDVVLSNIEGVTATATALNNNSAVKITFSAAFDSLRAGNTFNYGRLKDAQGNYTASLVNNLGAGVQPDLIATGDITNVKVVSADTVTFEVEQSLSGIDSTRFVLQGQPAGQAFYVNQKVTSGADGALVTVKLPKGAGLAFDTDANNFTGLQILAKSGNSGSALTNANSNGLATDVSVLKADVVDAFAPKVTTVETAEETNNTALDAIYVTFSEAMLASSVGLDSFNVAGYTITDVQADDFNPTTKAATVFKIVLKEKTYNDLNNKPTVSLNKDARDMAGNVLKAGSTLPKTTQPTIK